MKKKLLAGLATGLFMYGIVGIANATLIGDEISATGGHLSPSSATIGDGVEFTGLVFEYLNFDFADHTLTITSRLGSVSWNNYGYYVFSDFDDVITGMSVVYKSEHVAGTIVTNFTYTDDSITLDMYSGSTMGTLIFDIQQSTPVPEPTTMLLFGTGLVGLVGLRFRRKK